MRDVEAQHIIALMEFMYAGEVNVAQANLSAFLKTAESLKIRGLTDTSYENDLPKEEDTLYLNPQSSKYATNKQKINKPHISSSSTVTSSQDLPKELSPSPSPPPKRQCKSESEVPRLRALKEESMSVNPFAIQSEVRSQLELSTSGLQPKIELPDYLSDEEAREDISNFYGGSDLTELPGGMEIIPQAATFNIKGGTSELTLQSADSRKLHSLDPRPCIECGRVYSNLSNLRQHMKLIHYPTYVNCDICNKSFKTDLYLRRHMIGAHNNVQNRSFADSKPVLSLNRVKMEIGGLR
ncbi:hypothetical protein HHI36_007171 [Cryptolaemus montrouzieri]